MKHICFLLTALLLIADGVNGGGNTPSEAALKEQFDFARRVFSLEQADTAFTVQCSTAVADILRGLNLP